MTAVQAAHAANDLLDRAIALQQEAQTAVRAAVASSNAAAHALLRAAAAYGNAGSLITTSTTTTGHALAGRCSALQRELEQFRNALDKAADACNPRLASSVAIKDDGEKYARRLAGGG